MNIAVPDAHAAQAHFVDHVMRSQRDVQASEDILAASGMKLLAKGVKVDAATRERLLAHKLAKPLEQCLQVSDAVDGASLGALARRLLDEQPLLQRLQAGRSAASALERLPLTGPLRSLLSLYGEAAWVDLDHPVATALIAQGLACRVHPDGDGMDRTLLTAALLHDIGELYLDPRLFTGMRLDAAQWRQVVAHPIVGQRVLLGVEGAGQQVADAVLHHHERHDGFGYPQRLAAKQLSRRGELLAAAEWLAGLMRRGRSAETAADAACKLMPGSFSPRLAQAIRVALAGHAGSAEAPHPATSELIRQLLRLSATVRAFARERSDIERLIAAGGPASAVLAANHQRMEAIERSFVSAGLSGEEPLALMERLRSFDDESMMQELAAVVRELGWRLRELERDTLLRASALAPADQRTMHDVIQRLKPSDED